MQFNKVQTENEVLKNNMSQFRQENETLQNEVESMKLKIDKKSFNKMPGQSQTSGKEIIVEFHQDENVANLVCIYYSN